ncbi:Replication protein A 32 kDa subunit A [Hondaea fermentalgiana]|uniref:Replication protein A 32 kDa subunit A n=1 Tax=Hondaea fermentalgiana TaxID=2315210 RepID=A0A2R5G607_9STRA|nr:Replication protein A 32 kDa subunit A [Hondaea fermentalgiana]|eukprot:GBG26492.1 Replication protein A 32 kDa subunit A [Hondaea fermentalgiana]
MSGYGDYGDAGGYGGGGDYGDGGYGGGGGGGGGGYDAYGGFGDGGAANGGGFMNDGNGNSQGSPTSKRTKVEYMVPVTIRQMIEANEQPEAGFMIDGRLVQKVSCVGKIMNTNKKSASFELEIEDSTGNFTVQKWLQNDEEEIPDFPLGSMVMVYGTLRTFNGKRNLSCFAVRPIDDQNIMTHHFLEAMMAHLQVTQGPVNADLRASQQPAMPTSSTMNSGYDQPGVNPAQALTSANVNQGGADGDLASKALRIFNAPEAAELEEGYTPEEVLGIMNQQGSAVTLQQIMEAIHGLTNEGHLYSTIDDNHYKSTGEG